MSKFHINKHGVPAPCRAMKGKCPLGGADGNENHFATAEEAQAFVDKLGENKHGLLPGSANQENVSIKLNVSQEAFNEVFPDTFYDQGYPATGPTSGMFEDLKEDRYDNYSDTKHYKEVYESLPQEFHDEVKDEEYWRLVKEKNIKSHMEDHVFTIGEENDGEHYQSMIEKVKSINPNLVNEDDEMNDGLKENLVNFATKKVTEESTLNINGENFYVDTNSKLNRDWIQEYSDSKNGSLDI